MWGDEARDEEQGLEGTRLLVLDGLAHISHQVREGGGCDHRRDVLEGVGVAKIPSGLTLLKKSRSQLSGLGREVSSCLSSSCEGLRSP